MTGRTSAGRLVAVASLILLVVLSLVWISRSGGGTESVLPTSGPPDATTSSSSEATPTSGLATIRETRLPVAARRTLELIRAGGPFPYAEDGQTFRNREGVLPSRIRGYYKEYTVKDGTRGDRGPLRIVEGGAGDLYWTEDHYDSFRQIEAGR